MIMSKELAKATAERLAALARAKPLACFGRGDYAEPQYGLLVFGALPAQRGPRAGLRRFPRRYGYAQAVELVDFWP
jgi:hypothetical protein